jgi:HNH endonuclease
MTSVPGKSAILQEICDALSSGDAMAAAGVARSKYPFTSVANSGRAYNELDSTRIFLRDGFIDRYSGHRLVFPATLRLLSRLLPNEFPFHPNWKMSACHVAYWELFPTVDHVIPVARGGADSASNWVTTSMLRNGAKSNWTLEDLGWSLVAPGKVEDWDGLVTWFLRFVERDSSALEDRYIRRWQAAALRVRQGG